MTRASGPCIAAAFCCCILCPYVANTIALLQNGQWTWVEGSNSANAQSTMSDNHKKYPGARHGTTAWTDNTGHVWMYGGEVEDKNTLAKLDELWMFDTKIKTWYYLGTKSINKTWPVPCVDCASCSHGNQAIVFGGLTKRKGVDQFHTWVLNMTSKKWSVINKVSPPPRERSTYWCDHSKGELWLYGGVYKSKDLQDMWQFSFSTMKWNQIHIPKNSSSPHERFPGVSWAVHSGNLFLFGGSSLLGLMSDLWVFSTTLKHWKLLKGYTNHSQVGVYGHKGVPSNLSIPGSRSGAASWNDDQGHLWMFGGRGYGDNGDQIGLLSDLWMFNVSSSEWTWIGGPSTVNEEAVYGKQGQHSPRNVSGPRESSLTFRQGKNLWVFGGFGRDLLHHEGPLNDMWVYSDICFGPPSKSNGLPGDTIDMPYTQRLLIAFGILTIAMIISLLVCYRKECNIMYWRYKKISPKVKYEPLEVKMQVPDV